MATWVRVSQQTVTATDASLTGNSTLDNGTAPADFDPAGVTQVKIDISFTVTGLADDSWDFRASTGHGAQLESVSVGGLGGGNYTTDPGLVTTNGTKTAQVIDNSPDTTKSTANWEEAHLDEDGTTNLYATFAANKMSDGSTASIAIGDATVTITYTPASTDRKARVAFAEMEVPNAPRKARVAFAELEVPTAPRKARVAFAEMEVPDAPPSITLIGTVQAGGNSNGGDVTLTFDGSPAENDMVLLFTGHGTTGTENPYSPSTAGYTEVPSSHIYDTTGAKTSFAVFYKFMGATPDTSVTVQGDGVGTDATAAVSYMLRGVDQATPLDTAIQMGAEFAATTTPDPPSITTVTANAWVFAAIQWSNATSINTYPSGYTNTGFGDGVDTNRIRLGTATKVVASPGAEDPGTYSLSGTAEGYPFTLAIRPGSPTADRKARVSFGELEVPNAPRKVRVSFAELEVPTAPRRARVSFAEMEIPTAPRRARVAFAEMEVPNAPRKARVAFAALETPDAPRKVRVSFAELETGDGARRVRVSFAEMEIPTAPRKGRVSYAAFETPNAPTPNRQAQVSFAEFEVPTAPRRGRVSFAEVEASDAPRRSRVSFAEFEVPEGQRKARVSFAELEVPTAPRRAQVTFAEFEIPTAPRKARVSFAELETPSFARRCVLVWCVLEAPNAPTLGKTRTRMMVKFTQ